MSLPDAVPKSPSCGACGAETSWDDGPVCYECQLVFDPTTMEAEFLDADAVACRTPCGNYWHDDNKIRPGWGYQCSTCQLPEGHTSDHWTDCEPIKATEV